MHNIVKQILFFYTQCTVKTWYLIFDRNRKERDQIYTNEKGLFTNDFMLL